MDIYAGQIIKLMFRIEEYRCFQNFTLDLNIKMKRPITKFLSRTFTLIFFIIFLFTNRGFCQKKYSVQFIFSGKDSSYNVHDLNLKSVFDTKENAELYLNQLPQTLYSKGFAAASVDSVFYDSTIARVKIFLGQKYKWARISTDSLEQNLLDLVRINLNEVIRRGFDFYHN